MIMCSWHDFAPVMMISVFATGIPCCSSEDASVADTLGLSYTNVLDADGTIINSEQLSGLTPDDACEMVTEQLKVNNRWCHPVVCTSALCLWVTLLFTYSEYWLWRSHDEWEGTWLAYLPAAVLGNANSHDAVWEIWGESLTYLLHIRSKLK